MFNFPDIRLASRPRALRAGCRHMRPCLSNRATQYSPTPPSASSSFHVELLANHAFLSPHVARRRWAARCYSVLRSEWAGNFLVAYNTVKSVAPFGQHESNVDDGGSDGSRKRNVHDARAVREDGVCAGFACIKSGRRVCQSGLVNRSLRATLGLVA